MAIVKTLKCYPLKASHCFQNDFVEMYLWLVTVTLNKVPSGHVDWLKNLAVRGVSVLPYMASIWPISK